MSSKTLFQKGFTLVEMTVVIVVLGLLIGFFFAGADTALRFEDYTKTNTEMDIVTESLHEFAKVHGRYPCPADRTALRDSEGYGVELADCLEATDSAAVGVSANDLGAEVLTGALPVRTLNLPDSAMFDEFDSQLVYAVSASHVEQKCEFQGDVVENNATIELFEFEQGNCDSKQTLQCDNGLFYDQANPANDAFFTFTECTWNTCTFNGRVIDHGTSVTAWNAASSQNCQSQTRTCSDGELPGSFTHTKCEPHVVDPCTGKVVTGITAQQLRNNLRQMTYTLSGRGCHAAN